MSALVEPYWRSTFTPVSANPWRISHARPLSAQQSTAVLVDAFIPAFSLIIDRPLVSRRCR
jgi:hypothetical protein